MNSRWVSSGMWRISSARCALARIVGIIARARATMSSAVGVLEAVAAVAILSCPRDCAEARAIEAAFSATRKRVRLERQPHPTLLVSGTKRMSKNATIAAETAMNRNAEP